MYWDDNQGWVDDPGSQGEMLAEQIQGFDTVTAEDMLNEQDSAFFGMTKSQQEMIDEQNSGFSPGDLGAGGWDVYDMAQGKQTKAAMDWTKIITAGIGASVDMERLDGFQPKPETPNTVGADMKPMKVGSIDATTKPAASSGQGNMMMVLAGVVLVAVLLLRA